MYVYLWEAHDAIKRSLFLHYLLQKLLGCVPTSVCHSVSLLILQLFDCALGMAVLVKHSLWCIAWFPWRAKQPAGPVLCLPSQHSTTRSMVHQSMASHLQGWGHLLHWGHSHTPMFIRVNLYAVLQCTVCLYKCLLCPVDLAELCPNQHDSSAEAQGVKCRSVVQVSQVAKHSSCERFIFSTSTVRLRGQRSTKPAKQTSCR